VMSGTGMLTLPAILAARRTVAKPILSSNLCSAWWLLRTASQRTGSALFTRAAPELAALLQDSANEGIDR
jgi:maleate isomerase